MVEEEEKIKAKGRNLEMEVKNKMSTVMNIGSLQKVVENGNSLAMNIPDKVVKVLGINKGDFVQIYFGGVIGKKIMENPRQMKKWQDRRYECLDEKKKENDKIGTIEKVKRKLPKLPKL